MKVVYVAGPYRSKEGINGICKNIDAAKQVSRELWGMGLAVVCPHTNSALMDGPDLDDSVFLDGDLEILARCDAIIMIANWESSSGACNEREFAIQEGLEVFAWESDRGAIIEFARS